MRDWEQFRYSELDGVATVTFGRGEALNERAFEVYRDMAELAARPTVAPWRRPSACSPARRRSRACGWTTGRSIC